MDYPLQKQIKTSVVACIVDEQQRILLTRRNIPPFFGQWVMPGGKIDHGEPIHTALKREVQEEVGLEVTVESLIDVYEHVTVGERRDHYIILYYRATPQSFELSINPDELSEAVWFAPEQLPKIDVPPGCRHILAQLHPQLAWSHLEPPGDLANCEIPGVCPVEKG
ncbi:NUDIX domain-containing protein [Desulfuromonas acetoxidans]|uniref:m7GpppN-mRNA hydrolase NUDT17 n=1 Tax=Desulfuromonas acetoxidans (strain DSM 684 / 11070) TaxID=281689 RepID=Q1K3B2_DESA6|nr:NUDIX hydrolase [Desulfuromonas acetoxidans]EAT17062.1 NUDIX hydrolase [Desulfuromonas acetoxidans DSM 684]MBF0645127.1 NUDIX hydrolase [Desulfuromonas acetoxidans]NVD24069.1 NUDIX hydrolase [Desulfuromonas acetoxidans]NVE16365.1 NUDIX hydrolase [Desulfuromonas acetoxidans]